MKKYFLFFIALLLASVSYAQIITTVQWNKANPGNIGDTIYYSPGKKLNWNNFKGNPDNRSVAAAITESGFGYKLSMQSKNGRTNLNITVFCYFNKVKSWVKPGMNTDYALTHEQHHFDITYINTCLFIEKLRHANFTMHNFAELVDQIHDECFNALDKMQDDYDGQTLNGRKNWAQDAWNKKIDLQLETLVTD